MHLHKTTHPHLQVQDYLLVADGKLAKKENLFIIRDLFLNLQISFLEMNHKKLHDIITNSEYIEFINKNLNSDVNALRLKHFSNITFDVKFAILQIECKNRIKKKLPELFANNSFLFPSTLSTEQCTAQSIAQFHASLLKDTDSVLDMTAGLCIDTYYMAQKVKNVTAIEINEATANISAFNMSNLTENVHVICDDCVDYISDCKENFDVVFIDPARRGDNNKRLFGLTDCQPNVIELMPQIANITNHLYIKASSMIDISQSIRELQFKASDIWVVGVNNECKELLLKVDFTLTSPITPNIHAINFEQNHTQSLSKFFTTNTIATQCKQPAVNQYIYEPNRCIMKAQIFDVLETHYQVSQIHRNSHLFISEEDIPNFPGRRFRITEIIPFKSKEIKTLKNKHPQINVSVRNFKLSAEELKKKLKVKDGGDMYMFGTTDNENNAILIICKKA